jgi:hypothetical protein
VIRWRRWLGALARLALVTGTAGCAQAPDQETPTFTVTRGDWVHRVRAEGHLRATRTTPVPVSQDLREVARIVWLAPDGAAVAAGEVVARLDPTQMEERLAAGALDLASNQRERDLTRTAGVSRVTQTEKDGAVAELELDVAERYLRTDEQLFSRFQIIESEIDATLALEKRGHAERMRDVHQRLAEAELGLLEVERRKVELAVEQARRGLEMLEVRAPHAGLLLRARDHQGEPLQVGAQVWRGQTLGEIPDLAAMEAEVFVLETDAGGLAVGQRAAVTVGARPGAGVAATVRRVDSVARPKDRGSPVQYFGVTLELSSTDRELMKPGQRVDATLVLAELEDVIVVPRQAVAIEGERAQVWLRRGGRFERQAVEVERQSAGRAVIAAGLAPGDVIALVAPAGTRDRGSAAGADDAASGGTPAARAPRDAA